VIDENAKLRGSDINTLSLSKLYMITMKRTIKKVLGEKLTNTIKRYKKRRRPI
jgi:hypothetical protein